MTNLGFNLLDKQSQLLSAIALESVAMINEGHEPRSAIKQVASDHDISFGDEMENVVLAVESLLLTLELKT